MGPVSVSHVDYGIPTPRWDSCNSLSQVGLETVTVVVLTNMTGSLVLMN